MENEIVKFFTATSRLSHIPNTTTFLKHIHKRWRMKSEGMRISVKDLYITLKDNFVEIVMLQDDEDLKCMVRKFEKAYSKN